MPTNKEIVQEWLRGIGIDAPDYTVADECNEALEDLKHIGGLADYETEQGEYYEILVVNQLGIDFHVRCEADPQAKLLKLIISPKKKEDKDEDF